MKLKSVHKHYLRNTRLFGPMVLMLLGVMTMLVLLAGYLLQRFDISTGEREQHVVESGFRQHVAGLEKVVATQVNWDDAVISLDRDFSAK